MRRSAAETRSRSRAAFRSKSVSRSSTGDSAAAVSRNQTLSRADSAELMRAASPANGRSQRMTEAFGSPRRPMRPERGRFRRAELDEEPEEEVRCDLRRQLCNVAVRDRAQEDREERGTVRRVDCRSRGDDRAPRGPGLPGAVERERRYRVGEELDGGRAVRFLGRAARVRDLARAALAGVEAGVGARVPGLPAGRDRASPVGDVVDELGAGPLFAHAFHSMELWVRRVVPTMGRSAQ